MTETTNPNLMTIGRFSSLTRLSVRMLRHYDSHGVLVPADIDPWTGYRRYSPPQLADAADIRNLRDVGFGVAAIGALLAARGTPAWSHALQSQRESLPTTCAPPRRGSPSSPTCSTKENPACRSPSTAPSFPR